jgi:hypothetical protein
MKIFLFGLALALGLEQSAQAYSLGGPIGNNPKPAGIGGSAGDSWQTATIGYGLPGDLVAPKNLGEEYRRNLPVEYYAEDAAFLDYYGSNGVVAIDQACAILNNTFTNSPTGIKTGLNGYSAALSEFPLNSTHFNYQAQALGLWDMKSMTLGIFMEQFGLADPVRYDWTLRDRISVPPLPCPQNMEYLVIQRNFDFISSPLNQLQASPFVNDTLYSYQIDEDCPPASPTAVSVPYSVDPLADVYSPVASSYGGEIAVNTTAGLVQEEAAPGIYSYGAYFTGLTRDDVAGLRYLLSTNNLNVETADATSSVFTITTNTTSPTVFPPYVTAGTAAGGYYVTNGVAGAGYGYGNLAAFLAFTSTNGPAAVQAAYPGVVITSYTTTVGIVSNVNYTVVYVPPPVGSPYGTPPVPVLKTNYTPVFLVRYNYTFANVFTNHYTTGSAKVYNITVSTPNGAPVGSPGITNVTITQVPSVGGDFFVLPPFYTNVCPIDIIPTGPIVATLSSTNGLALVLTNTTTTNIASEVYEVTYFTNYSYAINPVTCTQGAAPTNLFQGIAKIQLVKSTYDSLLGQFFSPITNNYTLVAVINGQPVVQYLQRVVTTPDFLFSAADIDQGGVGSFARNVSFDQNNAYSGLAGPGTITSPSIITFNKAGPAYYDGTLNVSDVLNGTPFFTELPGSDLADTFFQAYFVMASYDGTTNAPVVYPNGTSIDQLANQVLMQVTTTPSGPLKATHGGFYHVLLTPSGGALQPPYTWSSLNLPPGLSIASNPDGSATIFGTPTQAGVFTFTLTLMDSLSRSVQWTYTITIQ